MVEFSNDCKVFKYVNNFKKYSHVKSIKIFGEDAVNSPKISIVIPTFKRPLLLKEAIQSALNQYCFDDYEIIIVDNDEAGEFKQQILEFLHTIKTDKVRYYINGENIGLFGNWNRGIELARGEWMCILSDDDFLLPQYLYNYNALLIKHPDVSRAVSLTKIIKNNQIISKHMYMNVLMYIMRLIKHRYSKLENIKRVLCNSDYPQSVMYKRNLAIEVGGYNPEFFPSSDWIFYIKYDFRNLNLYRINKHLTVYRVFVNESNKLDNIKKYLKKYIYVTQILGKILQLNKFDLFFIKIMKIDICEASNSKICWKTYFRKVITLIYKLLYGG